MLKRPISDSDAAPSHAGRPLSAMKAGRCVATKVTWKPQTKKPAVSSQKPLWLAIGGLVVSVAAQDGRIRVAGMTRPGLYLAGPVERLTAPGLAIESDTRLDQRRADTRIKLKSDALIVDAGGMLDFAKSEFGNFAVDAQLLTPGAIAPNLNGRDVLAGQVSVQHQPAADHP